MESYLSEKFEDVKPKNSSEEALERWMKLCWIVKNRWWCKAKWPHYVVSSDIVHRPWVLNQLVVDYPSSVKTSWVKPQANSVKFNVDGTVEGGFGRAGIGGILRNAHNISLILFSRSVGVVNATFAELLAIREALLLFGKSKWLESYTLILETDYSLGVTWIKRPAAARATFKSIIANCPAIGESFSWDIQCIQKGANCVANRLAKSDISRLRPLVWKVQE